jgi:hypothetical protein
MYLSIPNNENKKTLSHFIGNIISNTNEENYNIAELLLSEKILYSNQEMIRNYFSSILNKNISNNNNEEFEIKHRYLKEFVKDEKLQNSFFVNDYIKELSINFNEEKSPAKLEFISSLSHISQEDCDYNFSNLYKVSYENCTNENKDYLWQKLHIY